jgi:hypothetical protein
VGRRRLRWEEYVWQDIRILGVRNWRSVASNREEWGAILRMARAHTGLMPMMNYHDNDNDYISKQVR